MRVAIVGYGTEGQSSAAYWHSKGDQITVCDEDPNLHISNQDYSTHLGPLALGNLHDFDVIVRTAGINPKKIIEANPDHPEISERITTSVNEFMRACPSKNIIGVTGTKGKGTTSTLIAKIIGQSGKSVHLGGNIGIAALDMLPNIQVDDWVVLELSSFQLSDINYSPHIGVCLMVVPEHLDWHVNAEDYYEAKARLFTKQTTDDIIVYNVNNEVSREISTVSNAQRFGYEVPLKGQKPAFKNGSYVEDENIYYQANLVCSVDDVKLRGRHNLENICAAITAAWSVVDGNVQAIKDAISNFTGLEHRIEFVKEVDGVKYYNDSFSTTPETAIACMMAFEEPKVMILGGSDKGVPFNILANEVIQNNVKHVIAIGDTAEDITALLRNRDFSEITEGLKSMAEIVSMARKVAHSGDVVLLSTGCASFGLFENYKDRGNQFKQAVNYLS